MPNSGLDIMIDLDKLDDLARLYRLFSMVPAGVPTLRKALRETVIRRGRDISSASVSMEGDDPQEEDVAGKSSKAKGKGKARANAGSQVLLLALKWVQDVLDMKDKFDKLWTDAFRNDREIESSVNEVRAVRRSHHLDNASTLRRRLKRSSTRTRRHPNSSLFSLTTT